MGTTYCHRKGVTEGDNEAMALYALSTWPFIQALNNEIANDEVKQVWYADDSSAVRREKMVGIPKGP